MNRIHALIILAMTFITTGCGGPDASSATGGASGRAGSTANMVLDGKYTGSTVGDSLTSYTFYRDGTYMEDLWFAQTGSIYQYGNYHVGEGTLTMTTEEHSYDYDFVMESQDSMVIGSTRYWRDE